MWSTPTLLGPARLHRGSLGSLGAPVHRGGAVVDAMSRQTSVVVTQITCGSLNPTGAWRGKPLGRLDSRRLAPRL